MDAPNRPGRKSLERLERLVKLAEETRLYLDLTGLACYRKQDVPAWYAALSEPERWRAQARFWEAVARPLRRQPGHLLLRPDERTHRSRRHTQTRRLAHGRTQAGSTIASLSPCIRGLAPARKSRAAGSPNLPRPSASTTVGI